MFSPSARVEKTRCSSGVTRLSAAATARQQQRGFCAHWLHYEHVDDPGQPEVLAFFGDAASSGVDHRLHVSGADAAVRQHVERAAQHLALDVSTRRSAAIIKYSASHIARIAP